MKSLKVIQSLAKAGKIISKIIYICCCIGFWAGIVAIVSYAILGEGGIKIGGTTVLSLIRSNSDISAATIYAHMASAVVLCAAEAFIARLAVKYFEKELTDGTPFTYDGARDLMKLGIAVIVAPICAVIICSIGVSAAGHFYPEIVKPDWYDNSTSTGVGVAMIIMSLLCKHGAELAEAYMKQNYETRG